MAFPRDPAHALCVITDEVVSGRSHEAIGEAALRGGARFLQLREKRGDLRRLLEAARTLAAACRDAEALLVINDRLDVALAAGADGVHLGQEDLPAVLARPLLGPDRLLGISTNRPEEASEAEGAGADYVGAGPAYATGTKERIRPVLGSEGLRRIRAATRLPVFAVGGITLDRVPEVLEAGADGVAVVSAIAAAPDVAAATRAFLEVLAAHYGRRSELWPQKSC
ncbi:MAG TPA: thiamine phosphate synthase [Candidatus Methylomirabilis sp.]|jgi:thiamine-phosphate pyrophosphorylase|nr:thiamine phosphate synthase [Candidatus Methylomirabilis sp.]